MTREQFDSLYLGKAVHCPTEELADEFLELADSVGYKWRNGEKLTVRNGYCRYKTDTCYRPGGRYLFNFGGDFMSYGDVELYVMTRFEIVEFKSAKPAEEPFFHKVLEYLGVGLNEEFTIEGSRDVYKFNDMFEVVCKGKFTGEWRPSSIITLSDLITGRLKIIKTPLLTDEEREFLRNFEFDEVAKNEDNLALRKKNRFLSLLVIELKYCKHKFKGLGNRKIYTRAELGL